MENYILAKKIVSYKFSEDYSYYPFLVLAIYGLLTKYSSYKDVIDDLFQKIDLYIENKPVKQILIDHGIDDESFNQEEDHINEVGECYTYAVSSRGENIGFDQDGNPIPLQANPFIACSLLSSPAMLLHAFIHEFNHLVKGYFNGCEMETTKKGLKYHIRSGLHGFDCEYNKKKDTFSSSEYFNTLDELINVLQTTEMVQEISALDGIVPDQDVQRLLSSLNPEHMKNDFGYNDTISLIRPLWENPTFKSIMEEHLMDGDLEDTVKKYDSIMGKDSLEEFAFALDEHDRLVTEGIRDDLFQKTEEYIQTNVALFLKKTDKSYQK